MEHIDWIEIDYPFCSRTFGTGACGASLSVLTHDKCFNTTATCSFRQALALQSLTLRFIQPNSGMPKGGTWFPCLKSVSGSSSTVNIAGANPDLAPLGKRAEITAQLANFPYHDRLMDKYHDQRKSGAANWQGKGYDPAAQGTFFGRMRSRWPFYAGRPMRKCAGVLSDGVLTTTTVRHFIITDMAINKDGSVTISGKDILDLVDDKRVQAPKAANGTLATDAPATGNFSFDLAPEGIGDLEYPASGRATIGSEMVRYTRSGDTVTVTARAIRGTQGAAHTAGDSFQRTFSLDRVRLDEAIRRLIVNYSPVDAAFIPLAKWKAEVDRWAPTLTLSVDITKPEGVAKLIGEIAILGVSIWWDEVAQEIGLKMNRPPDLDFVRELSDRDSFMSFEVVDRDEDRLTTVQFFSVVLDPTKSATDSNNYARQRIIIDGDAVSPEEYGDSRIKEIHCRWLNHGDDASVAILGRRYLNRFSRQPQRFTFTVDAKDDMGLTHVAEMTSRDVEDIDGSPQVQMVEIVSRNEISPQKIEFIAQAFRLDMLYGYITENNRPDFPNSTPEQRRRGFYICDNTTLKMSDGSDPYRII